jgi:hypothetical protein
MKLYYLPNEGDESNPALRQVGPRKSFERLRKEGLLSDLRIYSFLSKFRHSMAADAVKNEILAEAASFKPDIIFWQHVSEFPVDDAFLTALKKRSQCRLFVYQDLDAFGRIAKRISRPMAAMFRIADLTYMCGTGGLFDLARRHGARDVRYFPHTYDNIRFGHPWKPTLQRAVKLTMIGGRIRRRIPVLPFPGARSRRALAVKLDRIFGKDFALYGPGWDGIPSARGPLQYTQQERALQSGWISINWDHFDRVPYYFSDRLPISLAAGVPHVTSYHPGYEFLFRDCPGLYAVHSVDEAVACAEWLLSRPRAELIAEGLGAKAWVEKNLESDVVHRQAIETCIEKIGDDSRQ